MATREQQRKRRRALYSEWLRTGRNAAALARKHGITKVTMGRLLARARAELDQPAAEPQGASPTVVYWRERHRKHDALTQQLAELLRTWKAPRQ
jgi:transposase-like protein